MDRPQGRCPRARRLQRPARLRAGRAAAQAPRAPGRRAHRPDTGDPDPVRGEPPNERADRAADLEAASARPLAAPRDHTSPAADADPVTRGEHGRLPARADPPHHPLTAGSSTARPGLLDYAVPTALIARADRWREPADGAP